MDVPVVHRTARMLLALQLLISTLMTHHTAMAAPTAPPLGAAAATSAARLASCLAAIPGRPEVLLPSAPDFLLLANGMRTMRTRRPAAVVFPATVGQVQGALSCAAAAGVAPIPRSGGFSFENLSSGDGALVIDLTSLAGVSVDLGSNTATIQMGTRHGNMYNAITTAGRAAGRPGLTCLGGVWPQIGVGGLMAAGGYGSFTRKHGLFVDSVLSAKVVLANGTLVTASPTANPDLFWAINGGGGGTYGIVTEATVRLYEYPVVTIGALWLRDLSDLPTFMDRFQRWAPGATDDLTFTVNIGATNIELKLVYLGPKQQLDALMANASGLTGFPGARYASVECDVVGSRWWLVNNRFPPVCKRDYDQSIVQRLEVGNRVFKDRKADKLGSGYFRELLPAAAWKELQGLMLERRGVGLQTRLFLFKAFGGFLDTVPDDATPFPHRKGVRMSLEYGIMFGTGRAGVPPPPSAPPASLRLPSGQWTMQYKLPPATQVPPLLPAASNDAAVWSWYQRARSWVARYGQSERYAGYANYDDQVPQYFQANYARLRAVKKRYDPLNVFHNVLSVPAA